MSSRRVSFVSLGCPKALVDSEHIVTKLADSGYEVVSGEENTDVLVVNTCGFINSAKQESFSVIEQALADHREVIVTGCLGADADALLARYPMLKHVSGPAQVAPVIEAVQTYLPGDGRSVEREVKSFGETHLSRQRLTPAHYAYLKISEGCNHNCSFCIIPKMRGLLRSRPLRDVVDEAHQLVANGARELLLIAQDLSAYGLDLNYPSVELMGRRVDTRLPSLCELLSDIAPWIRLHYVYPYPHVDHLLPLMADGRILPYLDVPLQHASPKVLKAMRRPAAAEKALERIRSWRRLCPDLAIRSTFIVGFPGESEEDVGMLLDFLQEAQLDRVGCFTYSPVEGAPANALPGAVDERDKLDRQEMVYELQAAISSQRLDRLLGRDIRVLIDNVGTIATARSVYDAPEIDGVVYIRDGADLQIGEFAWVRVERHDEHDLHGVLVGKSTRVREH